MKRLICMTAFVFLIGCEIPEDRRGNVTVTPTGAANVQILTYEVVHDGCQYVVFERAGYPSLGAVHKPTCKRCAESHRPANMSRDSTASTSAGKSRT
jgi:hypothetical protein